MTPLEEKLEAINKIAEEFAEMASSAMGSVVDLPDEELANVVGDRGHASAVLAHRIVGRLYEVAANLEVLACTLNRLESSQPLPPGTSISRPSTDSVALLMQPPVFGAVETSDGSR